MIWSWNFNDFSWLRKWVLRVCFIEIIIFIGFSLGIAVKNREMISDILAVNGGYRVLLTTFVVIRIIAAIGFFTR